MDLNDHHTIVNDDIKLVQGLLRVSRLLSMTNGLKDDAGLVSTLQALAKDRGLSDGSGAHDSVISCDDLTNTHDDLNDNESLDDDHLDQSALIDHDLVNTRASPTKGSPKTDNRTPRKRRATGTTSSRPHAAVERHYRSVLKSKIDVLHAQVPASGTFSLDSVPTPRPGELDGPPLKPEPKSVILDRAVRYLNNLVATYETYEQEHARLRQQLGLYCGHVS